MGISLSVARGGRRPGSRWRPRDWLLAQALTEYERILCPGCGNPLHESMDPALVDEWESPLPMRCHACTAIDHRAKDYAQSSAPGALRFSARRRGEAGQADADQAEKEAWYRQDEDEGPPAVAAVGALLEQAPGSPGQRGA